MIETSEVDCNYLRKMEESTRKMWKKLLKKLFSSRLLEDYFYDDFKKIGKKEGTYSQWKTKVDSKLKDKTICLIDEIKKYEIALEKSKSRIGQNESIELMKNLVPVLAIFFSTMGTSINVLYASKSITVEEDPELVSKLILVMTESVLFLIIYCWIANWLEKRLARMNRDREIFYQEVINILIDEEKRRNTK